MKNKLLYSILLLAVIAILPACNEWLNDHSKSQVPETEQFKTVEGFQQALIGCYIGMTDNMLYGKNLSWYLIEAMGQQYSIAGTSAAAAYRASVYEFAHSQMVGNIEGIWAKSYNVITGVNNVLKFIETNKSVLDNINYSVIKGELLAIRAYCHFDLMRLFGYGDLASRPQMRTRLAIPYSTGVSKDMPAQLSHEAILALIIADLKESLELLEQDPITGNYDASYYENVNLDGFFNRRSERFNYYAVKALLARVYMWEGSAASKNLALEAALDVIDNGVYTWATDGTAENDPTMSSEHLIGLNVSRVQERLLGYFMSSPSNTDYLALVINVGRHNLVYEVDAGYLDFRRTRMLETNAGSTPLSYTPKKYLSAAQQVTARSVNFPLIRIPEMYYIVAECYATSATPDRAAAVQYLNDVRRNRAIYTDLVAADLNTEQVVAEIMKEYMKEFLCEGVMFYYYKRLGMIDIPGYASSMDDSKYVLPYPDIEIQSGRVQ
ncbi:MAG: RagB/SusD family nutrient uptake outer membrane protein [Rikenellaceae bacterium]|nr:RagB/SusD family nutrient uptake outer membrane protein [Rikenellaceae bacterium]MCL2693085.1 RagB/SusD family nutrient uptake outer membrane protein [Rikenellaceae bacterium]